MRIGTDVIRGRAVDLKNRDRHCYVIGETGTGKSTLLLNMAVQDVQQGNGLCFLDPHGDSAEDLLRYIPPHRMEDVIYFDPSDIDNPIGFNPLLRVDGDHQVKVADSIIYAFKGIWSESWSETRMQKVTLFTLLALLEAQQTFLGITRFLEDEVYREKCLRSVRNPTVLRYWKQTFPKYKPWEQVMLVDPLLNRVSQFEADFMMRNILGQEKRKLKLDEVMSRRKILIVNLSKGSIGHLNSRLLGSLIVSQLFYFSMQGDRTPFHLYVDEFQNFTTASFADILSEARKYHLSLTIAHQYMGQVSRDIQKAVFGNVGSMVLFRVGNEDAEVLARQTGEPPTRFVDMPVYQAYALVLQGGNKAPFTVKTLPPDPVSDDRAETITQMSREHYGVSRSTIERKIGGWYESGFQA
jgi:DNA helicase HerA-like ATPase